MKKNIWSYPWKYTESFSIAFGILITGMIMEFFLPPAGTFIPAWPGNLYMLLAILAFSSMLYVFKKRSGFIKWLSSGYAAVALITAFTLLIIIMGLVPQRPSMYFYHQIGWTHINASWPFYLTGLLMVFCLFLSCAGRMKKAKIRNFIFLLNHAGLILILMGGALGKSDFHEMTMTLKQDEPVWYAQNDQGGRIDLDFAFEMKEFDISYHLPVMDIKDKEGEIVYTAELDTAGGIQKLNYDDYVITVEDLIPEAVKSGKAYKPAKHPAATVAAKIRISKEDAHVSDKEWIAAGNRLFPPQEYESGMINISLRPRQPKLYETTARLFTKQGENKLVQIKVNDPIEVNGWKIYQSGYDTNMGRWSGISIMQIVKDPWLPVLYTGIFMLIVGALGLFILGKSYKKEDKHA